MTSERDVVIVGGGPGGYATALRAAARGLSVTLVSDDSEIGGTCLHRGCVPSKALLHASSVQSEFLRLTGGSSTAEQPSAGLLTAEHLQRLRGGVVRRLHSGLSELIRSQGIEVVEGQGRLDGPGSVKVGDDRVPARNVVIATGSLPRRLGSAPVDGEVVVTSDHALVLDRIPAAPLIIGAGAVGVEFASMWADLGAAVTVVEMADRVLPLEDEASSAFLARSLKRRGIDVHLSAALSQLERTRDGAVVRLADGSAIEADLVLVATGRVPNTAASGAVELGLTDVQGFIQVGPHGRTSIASTWAVGDVVPTLALAHAAFAEGFVVADLIAGIDVAPVNYDLVPRVTYSHPEVASVGLTEAQARLRHADVQVTVNNMAGNARVVIEDGTGQVKLVSSSDGELMGVHIVGPLATELIAEATMAATWGALVEEAAAVVHAHPTLSETFREAALAGAGLPFHAHAPRRASARSTVSVPAASQA